MPHDMIVYIGLPELYVSKLYEQLATNNSYQHNPENPSNLDFHVFQEEIITDVDLLVQEEDMHFADFKANLFTSVLSTFAKTQIEFEIASQNTLKELLRLFTK